ncbi:hypothetical protein AAHB64_02420 [Bacillus toyonensis]
MERFYVTQGILSLGLCGAVLVSPATSFAAEENTSTGPQMIYTDQGFTNVEFGAQPVLNGAQKHKHSVHWVEVHVLM